MRNYDVNQPKDWLDYWLAQEFRVRDLSTDHVVSAAALQTRKVQSAVAIALDRYWQWTTSEGLPDSTDPALLYPDTRAERAYDWVQNIAQWALSNLTASDTVDLGNRPV